MIDHTALTGILDAININVSFDILSLLNVEMFWIEGTNLPVFIIIIVIINNTDICLEMNVLFCIYLHKSYLDSGRTFREKIIQRINETSENTRQISIGQ